VRILCDRYLYLILLCCIWSFPLNAQDWRHADRSSAGIAPEPHLESQALVHIYAARAFRWRKYFAVHCWVATKAKEADHYQTYHVTGFGLKNGARSVKIQRDIPDRRWFGAEPELLVEVRGEKAEIAIPQIQHLAENYFYHDHYQVWPGPNSNSFVSHIIRNIDGVGVELPPHAIGKDWINDGEFLSWSETGTGFQFSFFGLFGVTLGLAEGVELNLLGLSLGVDVLRPALKLPLIGRLGMKDEPVFE
jgi:hypothetical protein